MISEKPMDTQRKDLSELVTELKERAEKAEDELADAKAMLKVVFKVDDMVSFSRFGTYLTPTEVSERFKGHITVKTLANWRSLKAGPPFLKVGDRILYEKVSLEIWEDARNKQIPNSVCNLRGRKK